MNVKMPVIGDIIGAATTSAAISAAPWVIGGSILIGVVGTVAFLKWRKKI